MGVKVQRETTRKKESEFCKLANPELCEPQKERDTEEQKGSDTHTRSTQGSEKNLSEAVCVC